MKKQVEVIFVKDLPNIAQKGDIKKVRMGYARNYLIPQKFAKLLTPNLKQQLEIQKKAKETRMQKLLEKLKKLALNLQKTKLQTSLKVGEKDEIFGSVDASKILELLKEQGFRLEKNQIELPEPIKKIGVCEIPINLKFGIKTKIKLTITKEKNP